MSSSSLCVIPNVSDPNYDSICFWFRPEPHSRGSFMPTPAFNYIFCSQMFCMWTLCLSDERKPERLLGQNGCCCVTGSEGLLESVGCEGWVGMFWQTCSRLCVCLVVWVQLCAVRSCGLPWKMRLLTWKTKQPCKHRQQHASFHRLCYSSSSAIEDVLLTLLMGCLLVE